MNQKLKKVRVRFAPSPTGRLHQGNIRTALYNFLYAKQQQGDYLLRIDDTDLERSEEVYIESIEQDLKWLGIEFNEGYSVGGDFAPYKQSARRDIYQKYLNQLLENSQAYACFTPVTEIEEKRKAALKAKKAFVFRSSDRNLPWAEAKLRLAAGETAHFRFKVPNSPVDFEDLVYGPKHFEMSKVEDFTLARSDGAPLYLFVSAIDDALMGITHVIRGEDGLSNTPRQILIQQALGWSPPQFAHLPLILGPDHKLLSKRNGSLTVGELRDLGYLPEAVLHHLALLGWSPPHPQDCWSVTELIQAFQLEKVSRSPAVMDLEQLRAINHQHLIHLSEEKFLKQAWPWVQKVASQFTDINQETWEALLKILQLNLSTLQEIPQWLDRCLGPLSWEEVSAQECLAQASTPLVLKSLLASLSKILTWDETSLQELLHQTKEISGQKGKALFMPLRVALTGVTFGPEIKPLMLVLGRQRVEKRVQDALENL